MRLAAVADIHLKTENHERDIKEFSAVNDLADALVIAVTSPITAIPRR